MSLNDIATARRLMLADACRLLQIDPPRVSSKAEKWAATASETRTALLLEGRKDARESGADPNDEDSRPENNAEAHTCDLYLRGPVINEDSAADVVEFADDGKSCGVRIYGRGR